MPEYQYNCEAAVKKLHQGIIEQESEIDYEPVAEG